MFFPGIVLHFKRITIEKHLDEQSLGTQGLVLGSRQEFLNNNMSKTCHHLLIETSVPQEFD